MPKFRGPVAALVESHMNSLIPFDATMKQARETIHVALKQ